MAFSSGARGSELLLCKETLLCNETLLIIEGVCSRVESSCNEDLAMVAVIMDS